MNKNNKRRYPKLVERNVNKYVKNNILILINSLISVGGVISLDLQFIVQILIALFNMIYLSIGIIPNCVIKFNIWENFS